MTISIYVSISHHLHFLRKSLLCNIWLVHLFLDFTSSRFTSPHTELAHPGCFTEMNLLKAHGCDIVLTHPSPGTIKASLQFLQLTVSCNSLTGAKISLWRIFRKRIDGNINTVYLNHQLSVIKRTVSIDFSGMYLLRLKRIFPL